MKLNSEILAKIFHLSTHLANVEISGISTDSRSVGVDDLFIAVVGEKFDGHNFVADVVNNKNVSLVIVEKPIDDVPANRQIIVPNTRDAYLAIGQYIRRQSRAHVIALTGSAGKTTTKEELKFVLEKFGTVYATTGNFNNEIGVAQTLCAIPADIDFAVIEIGMSHAGEIAGMVKYVQPDVAIVTNVYPMHLENFEDISGIARAKAEIFAPLSAAGTAIINRDSNNAKILIDAARMRTENVILYGRTDLSAVSEDENAIVIAANIGGEKIDFELSLNGEHHLYNALCVLNTVAVLGLNIGIAAETLRDFGALPGRGKAHKIALQNGGEFTLIDESYSAQPESLKLAIQNFDRARARGRKIAIIGKMAEIGDKSNEMHTEIGRILSDTKINVVIGVCPETKNILAVLGDKFQTYYFETNDGLDEFLTGELLLDGDAVLIKGSHYGSRLFETAEKLILNQPQFI